MTVNKLWDDENDQDGKRDDVNATVQLYKQAGEGQKTAVGDPVEVGVADNWSKTWDNLPVKENGTTLVYSVVETLPDGSEYTKSGDDVTVTASKDGEGEINRYAIMQTEELAAYLAEQGGTAVSSASVRGLSAPRRQDR